MRVLRAIHGETEAKYGTTCRALVSRRRRHLPASEEQQLLLKVLWAIYYIMAPPQTCGFCNLPLKWQGMTGLGEIAE